MREETLVFSCKPIGVVRRIEPIEESIVEGMEDVIGYNEEIMRHPAKIELLSEYCSAIKGIKPGSLAWIIWYANRIPGNRKPPITVHPYRDKKLPEMGVFATRSPSRPCPICLTLVWVSRTSQCSLIVYGLDAYDNTPVIDIKLYYEGLDSPKEVYKRVPGDYSST